jgi:hypothetical protein
MDVLRREKSLVPAGIGVPDRPGHSFGPVTTELPRSTGFVTNRNEELPV